MGKISEIFNFDNIGRKIKNLAKWSCWITILLIWIAAPITLIVLLSEEPALFWIPLVSAIVGSVSIWIGSWAMYAFGEFVERTCDNEDNTRLILEKLTEDNYDNDYTPADVSEGTTKSAPTQIYIPQPTSQPQKTVPITAPESSPQKADVSPIKIEKSFSAGVWVCGKCKTKNLNIRNDCWSCGNPK